MQLWRISNYADLTGVGGLHASGRWHSRGRRIVYLADHPASALLEMLVHLDRDLIPNSYRLLRVMVPETIASETVAASDLAIDWRSTRDDATPWGSLARSSHDRAASRPLGNRAGCDQRVA